MKYYLLFLFPLFIFVTSGCASGDAPQGLGINVDNMDTTVNPQDNFYRYMNGMWLEKTEIPSDRSRWGSFDELVELSEQHVLEFIQEMAEQDAEEDSEAQKMGDLYLSFMDTVRINKLGITPLESELERINAIQDHDDLLLFWGEVQQYRYGSPISLYVTQDQMQSDQYITYASQSGLGLPDREYYLSEDDQSQELINQYKNMIAEFWDLAGWENGEQAAENVLSVERTIAESHWTRVQNRDRQATYNKKTLSELTELTPGIDWTEFIDAAGFESIDEIVVRQPTYLSSFADYFNDIDIDDWKQYLHFHLIRSNASYLSSEFDETAFNFYGRILSGQEEQRSREKRGVSTVEGSLGFLVGQEYVNRHFPQEANDRMDEMIDNLTIAFEQSINELEWMGDDTKKEALNKLSNFKAKIGQPEVWRDYDCVSIEDDDLIGNKRRSALCEYERNIGRLGEEVDRDEWGMTPQTVNAYYHPTLNEVVFPAAILQPPFFDVDADDAVNYGGIGAVIGHEISHGFDDQGRRSDGEGNLRDWWTEEDEEQFNARAEKMVEQYSAFNPIDDMFINGSLGLGENIADLGGLNVAYRAYQNSLNGREAPVIEGFTGDQRFFMGWGQVWRTKFRDEALRRQIMTGPHAPGKYRALGPVSNMPEFYEAFDVQPADSMYRDEDVRVKIW
ncbi:MAG: M13-type metalloendopeptidase [Balneolales bacterium]